MNKKFLKLKNDDVHPNEGLGWIGVDFSFSMLYSHHQELKTAQKLSGSTHRKATFLSSQKMIFRSPIWSKQAGLQLFSFIRCGRIRTSQHGNTALKPPLKLTL